MTLIVLGAFAVRGWGGAAGFTLGAGGIGWTVLRDGVVPTADGFGVETVLGVFCGACTCETFAAGDDREFGRAD